MKRFLGRIVAIALVAALGTANMVTQKGYLAGSARKQWETMLDRMRDLSGLDRATPVMIGLQDVPMPLLVARYSQGRPTWNLGGRAATPTYPDRDPSERLNGVRTLQKDVSAAFPEFSFDLGPDGPRHSFQRFVPPGGAAEQAGVVILPAGDETVLNGSQNRPPSGVIYTAARSDQRDTLVQIDSSLGHIIIPGLFEDIGLWQLEGDFAGSRGGMQGVGRHLLFEVLNPVPGSRFLLDFSSAGLAGQDIALPPAAVFGNDRHELGFAGRGAGRLLSDPVEPREIAGHYYVALDMGQAATRFHSERRGLQALYNVRLGLDPRYLVGFVRNISLLTPEQATALQPPSAVASFPAGLLTPGLLFSGVSEDGWIADRAWVRLGTSDISDQLHIKGDVPNFGQKMAGGTARILVDGEQVAERRLIAGDFEIVAPIAAKPGPRRIEFEMSGAARLPPPDGRLVSLHLASISLDGKGAAPSSSQAGSKP